MNPESPTLEAKDGIQSLELNVRELDLALKNYSDETSCGNYPSWKYPTVGLGNLDIEETLVILRKQNISDENLYIQLVELCVDRLYYSLLCSVKHMNNLCSKLCKNKTNFVEALDKLNSKKGALESVNKNHEEPNSLRRVNLAQMINQLSACFSELESAIFTSADQSQLIAENLSLGSGIDEQSNITNPCTIAVSNEINADENQGEREEGVFQCCESCFAVQAILKSVGETLENCLKALSDEPTCISTTKIQIRDEMYWCTHWNAIRRWCEALKTDCISIVEKVTENEQKNTLLENAICSTQQQLNMKNRDREVIIERMERKFSGLCNSIEAEQKQLIILKKTDLSRVAEYNELQMTAIECQKICKKETDQQIQLKDDIGCIKKLQVESTGILHSIEHQMKTAIVRSQCLHQTLKLAQNEKQVSKDTLLEETQTLLENVKNTKEKNSDLKKTLTALKKQFSNVKKQFDDDNKRYEKKDKQIQMKLELLQNELKETQDRLELMVISQEMDLTGRADVSEPRQVVADMAQQIIANESRIRVLNEQKERIRETLAKLRNCTPRN